MEIYALSHYIHPKEDQPYPFFDISHISLQREASQHEVEYALETLKMTRFELLWVEPSE